MAEQQLTVSEFAARIKAKYPEYKDINDLELSRKIVDKYPEYKSVVIFDDLKKKEEAIPSPSLDGESVSPEIEKKEDTFVEDALASSDFYNPVGKLIKGIPGIAEVYSGVENLVGSVFKAGEMAIRENLFAYASSNPAVAAAQNILRTASPIDNKISDALGAMGDFFMESSERTLLNKQKEYGISEEEISRGIVGNVIDGNVGTAAKLTASTVAHQIPQLAAMVATGGTAGAALLGTSAAGNKYAQIQDDPTLSSEEKAMYSLAIGAAEGLAEYMFRTDVSQIRRAFGKKETLDEFKNVLKQQLKKETLLKSTLEEGGEELVVGVVDLLIEDGLRGNFDNWNADAVLELADAALVGGIMGGGVHTVTRGVNALGSSKNERKQSEIKSDINTLNKKKKNATEDQKRVIDELIEEKVGELININTEDSEFYSNFSNEDIKEIISINKDIREASKKYNVAPSETLKKKYADEIKTLRDKKQNIENKYSETPTRYIKDGKELSRTEFVDMLNAATAEELATGQWGVQNDEEVEQLLTSKLPKETQELKVEKTAAEPKTEAEPEILVKNVEDQAINYKDPVSGEIVEGTLLRDGQQAIVETKDKLIEIGNFNEIQDQPISELGIEVQLTPDVKIAGDRVVIRGKEYVSESGNLNEDINYNEEGEVVSISLNTKDGKKRTFRGATAQEFVYQTWLQENASTPEDIAQAENELQELIETDEEARNILTQLTKEPKQVRTVTKDEDTQKVEGEKQQLTDVEYINQYNEDEVAVAEIDTTATAENSRAETERVKQSPIEEEDGTTLNLDGTTYEGDGLVVPFASDDFKSEEITPELIAEFVEKNKNKIPKGAKVVVGLYSFKGEDKVSIDLNVVVDESNLAVATEFARLMGQNSIYRISDGQTVPTGETGDNTVTLMDARARQAAIAITQGKLPQYLKGIRSPSEMAAYKAEQEKAYKKSQEKPKKQEYVDVKDLGKDDRTPKRVTDETVKKLQTMVDNFNKVLKKIGAQPYNITFAANNEQYEARYRELTGRDKSANRGTFIGSKREIIINLSSANEGTLAHEMMHAYLHALNITGKNILQLTNALYTELSTGSAIEKKIARELRKFQDEYIRRNIYGQNKTLEDPNIAEEFLTEYVGIMVQYSERIPASGKVSFAEKIRRAVLKFLTKLGIKDKSILQAIETREEAVNFINGFVNVLSDRAEVADLPGFLAEQGKSGEVGTIKVPTSSEQIEIIDAPKASEDSRSFIRNFVTDIKIKSLQGRKFVTNMYDYTNAGITQLGKGLSINLLGGRNYVPLMMERTGKKIGEVSNLAAFNTKEQAEGFIRNAKKGKADLFAPHSGTLSKSWQFQHNIFQEMTNLVLENKILSKSELIDIFNEALKSKEGQKQFKQFNDRNGTRLKNFNSFKKDPMKLVELLDAENNYSPELRKALNDKIAASKKVQKALGIKNKQQFQQLIADPMNQGIVGGEIMTFVEFDPKTFEIVKTKQGDPDHHPSFGWTVKAKIKAIYQPDKYYKSYDLTNEYTKYNTEEVKTSRKTDASEAEFIISNVNSSAGAIPKVAKVDIDSKEQIDFVNKPLYHGSNKSFDKFDMSKAGATDEGFLGRGVYLTAEYDNAKEYGDIVNVFYADIKNPLIIEDPYSFGGVNPNKIRSTLGLDKNASVSRVTKELKNRGYDAVVVNEIEGTDAIEVAVLDPSIISDKPKTKDVAKEQIDFAGIEMKVKETPGNTDPAIKTGGMAYVPVSRLYNLMDMRDGDRGGLYETARDKKRVAEIAERFKKEGFNSTDGWYQTIYVDIDAGGFGWIGEGNHRVLAARQLGMTHLPVRVEFGAARDGKFIYDKNYSRVPTQVVSKEKIAELKEKAGKYYHIKYASIWETNLPTNQEPVTKDQIDWQRSEFGRGQVNPAIVNRTTEVQQAAVDLLEGKITNKEYQDTVKFTQTIEAITRFFLPASTKDMKESLDSNKAELLNTPIEDGKEIGLRLDIPAYKNRNIWIVSVHDKGKAGKSISYGSVAWATDVNFGSNPKVAAFIAAGRNMDTLKKQDKTTIARMLGKWKNFEGKTKEERDAAAIKKVEEIVAIENKYPGANRTGSPWRQIGMNPFRHSFFYDRRNGKPVVSASEVVQIGGLVYAKDVQYADWSSDQFTVDGYYDADGAPVKFQVETQTDKKLVDALEKGEIPAPLYKKSLGEKIYAALFRTPLEMEILKLQEKKDAKISDLEYQGREIANRIKRYAKTPEALKLANEYLTKEDKKDSAEAILKLPNGQKLLDNLRTARGFIDNISSQLANDPAFEALPDELRLAISENITTYLRAQYKFFTDKSYDIDKRRDPAIQAQFNELVAREIAMLGAMGASDMDIKQIINDSRDDIIEEATQMIDSYISDLKDVKYQPSTTGAGIKMPNAPFRAKKDLPQYIKELLGEEKNPVNRFAQTTKSLANVLYKGEMINGIIELVGKDSDYILDEKPEAIKEKQYVKVSDPYSMLDGKYVHKEVMDMVNQKPLYTTDNFWANIYFTTLKLARKSKVIWNITTWRKNLTGGWYFIMANGVANPGFAKDFARRTKLMFNVRGEEFQVDEETKQLMRIMAETGLTGKSIDANLIGISQAAFQFGLDGDENAYYERAKKVFNNIAKKDKWLQEKYAAVDDYTKLIIFRSEIQSYAKKLYGKAYDQLTDAQKDNVHEQAAERVKQSTPTFSRLPKWYPKVAVIPVVGDFISFRLESLRSYGENVGNAVSDIKKSQESGLDEVQKKEYLQSGLRRLAGSGAVFALKLGITTFLADLFLDDDDEELEEDAKVLRPEWMDGQTIIPRSIDKDGNVRVYNYSSEDPYGDVSDIFGGTESWSAMIKDFVRPNIAANLIFNLSKGEDIYGGKIADYSDSEINNMIKVLNYTAKQIVVPPTVSSSFRDAYLRSELPKKDKIVNLATTIAERSVIRDYKYNIIDSFVQDLRKIGETRKSYYDYDNPAKRLKQLDEIKEQFDAIVRIGVAKNNFELIDKAEKYMKRHLESLDEEYVLDGIIIKKQ